MATIFPPQSFNEITSGVQILPLSPEDKAVLGKQKKVFGFIFGGILIGLLGFIGYRFFFQDLSFFSAFLIPGPSLLIMSLIWYLTSKKLTDSIDHSTKHVGTARVISKNCTSSTYWLVLDGSFKDMKRIYVSAGMYFTVQEHDLVYIEVLPTSKAALSLRKQ
jgi:hypothetical protein